MLKVVTNIEEREAGLASQTLDDLALEGARRMLHQALEEEVAAYLERHQERDGRGHALVWCVTGRRGRAR